MTDWRVDGGACACGAEAGDTFASAHMRYRDGQGGCCQTSVASLRPHSRSKTAEAGATGPVRAGIDQLRWTSRCGEGSGRGFVSARGAEPLRRETPERCKRRCATRFNRRSCSLGLIPHLPGSPCATWTAPSGCVFPAPPRRCRSQPQPPCCPALLAAITVNPTLNKPVRLLQSINQWQESRATRSWTIQPVKTASRYSLIARRNLSSVDLARAYLRKR